MFFEGSEKKLEIAVKSGGLKALPKDFWVKMVEASQAQILSELQNDDCTAYLLSESSLFVWDDRFTMITCGETQLIKSADLFLREFGKDNVDFCFYERKNEYRPQLQHTSFHEDMKTLDQHIPGRAFQFGKIDEHHLFLYHLDEKSGPVDSDTTFEILMYGLQGKAHQLLSCHKQKIEAIRDLINLSEHFAGFEVDDHLFDPCGYSLNALRGKEYYTIHVTPEESGSYVSFETNVQVDGKISSMLSEVLSVFTPTSFDVVLFKDKVTEKVEAKDFLLRSAVKETLSCGYDVKYCHFSKEVEKTERAFEITGESK